MNESMHSAVTALIRQYLNDNAPIGYLTAFDDLMKSVESTPNKGDHYEYLYAYTDSPDDTIKVEGESTIAFDGSLAFGIIKRIAKKLPREVLCKKFLNALYGYKEEDNDD